MAGPDVIDIGGRVDGCRLKGSDQIFQFPGKALLGFFRQALLGDKLGGGAEVIDEIAACSCLRFDVEPPFEKGDRRSRKRPCFLGLLFL